MCGRTFSIISVRSHPVNRIMQSIYIFSKKNSVDSNGNSLKFTVNKMHVYYLVITMAISFWIFLHVDMPESRPVVLNVLAHATFTLLTTLAEII